MWRKYGRRNVLSLGGVVVEGRNVCECGSSECREGNDLKSYHDAVWIFERRFNWSTCFILMREKKNGEQTRKPYLYSYLRPLLVPLTQQERRRWIFWEAFMKWRLPALWNIVWPSGRYGQGTIPNLFNGRRTTVDESIKAISNLTSHGSNRSTIPPARHDPKADPNGITTFLDRKTWGVLTLLVSF